MLMCWWSDIPWKERLGWPRSSPPSRSSTQGLEPMTIGLVGDLRYGRTVHSLAYALSLYKVKLVLISPDILQMRKEVAEEVSKKIEVTETPSLKDHLRELDVIYMTRVQKERFADLQEYEKVKGSYR